jgi:hypothetical protein
MVALTSLHCWVFLHLVGCQVAWQPLSASYHTFASFFLGWLSRQLIGFIHCSSFQCHAIEPSSCQAFTVKLLLLSRPANLGVKPSNHQSIQTLFPPIKPLTHPIPSSPCRPFNLSNPFSSCPAQPPPPPAKPSSHPNNSSPC